MNIDINLKDKIAYDSIYQGIYRNDILVVKYNEPIYDLVQEMKKTHIIYDEYNIEDIKLNIKMYNTKIDNDVFILLNDSVKKWNSRDYDHNHSLYTLVYLPNNKSIINNKYQLLSSGIVCFNDHFKFTFDGDTGDQDAGTSIRIDRFTSSHYPSDLCIGRTVQWVNKDGDTETHKITWMRSDHRYVKFDGDIKDTSDDTWANTIDDTHKEQYVVAEYRLQIKG